MDEERGGRMDSRVCRIRELLTRAASLSKSHVHAAGATGEESPSLSCPYLLNLMDDLVKSIKFDHLDMVIASSAIDPTHPVTSLQEIKHPIYHMDLYHDVRDCGDGKCTTIQQGNIILFLETQDIDTDAYAVAIQDEDKQYRSGFKVFLMNANENKCTSSYAIIPELNVQRYIEAWLCAHQAMEDMKHCTINKMLQSKMIDDCISTISIDNTLDRFELNQIETNVINQITAGFSCSHGHIDLINGGSIHRRRQILACLLVAGRCQYDIVVYTKCSDDIIQIMDHLLELKLPETDLELLTKHTVIFDQESDMRCYKHLCYSNKFRCAKMFLVKPGWRYYFNIVLQVLLQCHDSFKLVKKASEHISFLELFELQLVPACKELKNCLRYLLMQFPSLPSKTISSTGEAVKSLEELERLLKDKDLGVNSLKEGFPMLSNETLQTKVYCSEISEKLDKQRAACVDQLNSLKKSFIDSFEDSLPKDSLPKDPNEVKDFCLKNAKVVFCSSGNNLHLNDNNKKGQCLFVDEAHLLSEIDTVVPLSIRSLKSVVLCGDKECELPSKLLDMETPGSGCYTSLFERFKHLDCREHILHDDCQMSTRPERKEGQIAPVSCQFMEFG